MHYITPREQIWTGFDPTSDSTRKNIQHKTKTALNHSQKPYKLKLPSGRVKSPKNSKNPGCGCNIMQFSIFF